MKVLLSIKPEYVERIFSGAKKYEFRRVIFKNPEITTIIIYATSPIQKVVGEITIERIICDQVNSLWKLTCEDAGISEEGFFRYFGDRSFGYAIKIEKTKKYRQPLSLQDHFGIVPPQSFAYINTPQ
jgi:predicted transcriptional regulator